MKGLALELHDMHDVLSNGGSVLLNGAIITHHDELPSAVSMAKNDPEALAKVKADLLSRRQEIDRQLAEAQEAELDPEEEEEEDPEDEGKEEKVPKPVRRSNIQNPPALVGQTPLTGS